MSREAGGHRQGLQADTAQPTVCKVIVNLFSTVVLVKGCLTLSVMLSLGFCFCFCVFFLNNRSILLCNKIKPKNDG